MILRGKTPSIQVSENDRVKSLNVSSAWKSRGKQPPPKQLRTHEFSLCPTKALVLLGIDKRSSYLLLSETWSFILHYRNYHAYSKIAMEVRHLAKHLRGMWDLIIDAVRSLLDYVMHQ